MANVVKSKVVHDHTIPIVAGEFVGDMASNVQVYFCKVLLKRRK
jgi:hypothetical protein